MSLLLLCILLSGPLRASSPGVQEWNSAGIAWQSYRSGLEKAKNDQKPVCLVIYTTWCPHCSKYSRVFHDPQVIDAARSFVMIKVDRDASPELSKSYSVDGEYIPRTYFLSANGAIAAVDAGRNDYRYFYDDKDPGDLLSAMKRAIAIAR